MTALLHPSWLLLLGACLHFAAWGANPWHPPSWLFVIAGGVNLLMALICMEGSDGS